jgi:hypothetical protein
MMAFQSVMETVKRAGNAHWRAVGLCGKEDAGQSAD